MLWGSGGLFFICQFMEIVAAGLLVLHLTHSPWQVAVVGVARLTPMLVFGMFSGLIADRANRWRVMVAARSGSILVILTLALLIISGSIEVWHVFLGTMALGWTQVLDFPSRRSFIYDVVGRQNVAGAMSLETISTTLGKILGPLSAGLFIQVTGFTGAYVCLLSLYVLALLLVIMVKSRAARPPGASQPIWESLVTGLRYSIKSPPIRAVLIITLIMNALAFSSVQLYPVVARDHLGVGAALTGVLVSADGMGTLIGAIVITSLGAITYHGRYFVLGSTFLLVGLILFSFSSWYPLSFLLLLLAGLGGSGFSTMQTTILLMSSPPEMRGRALGVMGLCIGAGPIGMLEAGAIATLLNVQSAIGINAVVAVSLMLPVIFITPLVWRPIAIPPGVPGRPGDEAGTV